MDWQILESPVHFKSDAIGHLCTIHSFPEQKVLYRSDSKAPLSVVSQRYHTVQPREVLEFYRDLTEVSGYELETAGVLKGGRKFWALARTGQGAALKGNDQVNGYLLLATSCDGTLATTATPTTVRVVCNNTLTIALDGTCQAIKVPHNTRFDPKAVKKQLGIAVSQWDDFMYRMRALAERKVQWHEALGFFMNVLCETSPTGALPEQLPNELALRKVQELYEGLGRGSQLDSARGTAWGLLNAVTEYVDHERRARSNEYRMDSAWFGQGAQIKQRALMPLCNSPLNPHSHPLAPGQLPAGRAFSYLQVSLMKATSLNSSTRKKRPALRLVSTKELPREDWLQIRKQGIGSSDAAAAVGLNPYKSQLELWLERPAVMPRYPRPTLTMKKARCTGATCWSPSWPGITASARSTRYVALTPYCSIPIRSCPGCWPTLIAR